MTWLSNLFEALISVFPQVLDVRATHGGVAWRCGKHVKELKPGVYIYMPLITDVKVIVTARQTLDLVNQCIRTADNKMVTVAMVVVYRISDVVKAIGIANHDISDLLADTARGAVVRLIASRCLDELQNVEAMYSVLTAEVRPLLAEYGADVEEVRVTEL